MFLRIEAPETMQLIEELSLLTGEQAETVVQVALKERLARMSHLRTVEEEAERRAKIMALVDALQDAFRRHPEAIVDPAEFLYGDDGLPR